MHLSWKQIEEEITAAAAKAYEESSKNVEESMNIVVEAAAQLSPAIRK